MSKKKVCFVTGSRAEYGLLAPIMREIERDPMFSLQIIVTGMHLSPEFGLTYKEIERDGFEITQKVEMLLSSDTVSAITKSMGLGLIGFADVFELIRPDVVVLLGDRYETFVAAVAAHVATVPIAHLYGGETTQGAIDEAMRHAITKMSQLHFTATESYRKRVIQLGEHPEKVFWVGAIGVDNCERVSLVSKDQLERELGCKIKAPTALVTFHPVTLEEGSAEMQIGELLRALDAFPDLNVIFTMPNADTDGRIIISCVNEYVKKNKHRAASFVNLGTEKYLSLLQYVNVVVGNSSSGIVEVPSFHVPTVNIGDRQMGRVFPDTVLNVAPVCGEIYYAVKKALSSEFIKLVTMSSNPYKKMGTLESIVNILKEHVGNIFIKKQFYDFDYDSYCSCEKGV